ncbi:MAG: hypothetical protein ACYC3W_08795 [Candidatus Nanopelagicales bacterium]
MAEVLQARLEAAFAQALSEVTPSDLEALIAQIEAFGLGGDLDTVVRTARPGAKVQRRFMPPHAQAAILKAALRTAKAQVLVQDVVIGLYAEELGDAIEDPTLEQLQAATSAVLGLASPALVKLALIAVIDRQEVAAPHAAVVLRDTLSCDLTQ